MPVPPPSLHRTPARLRSLACVGIRIPTLYCNSVPGRWVRGGRPRRKLLLWFRSSLSARKIIESSIAAAARAHAQCRIQCSAWRSPSRLLPSTARRHGVLAGPRAGPLAASGPQPNSMKHCPPVASRHMVVGTSARLEQQKRHATRTYLVPVPRR